MKYIRWVRIYLQQFIQFNQPETIMVESVVLKIMDCMFAFAYECVIGIL